MATTGSVILRCTCSIFLVSVAIWSVAFSEPGDGAYIFDKASERVSGEIWQVENTERYQKITLRDVHVNDERINSEARTLILSPAFPPLSIGEKIVFRCNLEKPEPFNGFRYDRFLASKNVYATCFLKEAPLVIGYAKPTFRTKLLSVRKNFIKHLDSTFGEPQASLLAGLLVGEKRFTSAWDEKFQRTGTSHIVAASGYNVAVVSAIMFGLLTYLGLRRPRAFSLILASIIVYVILAGADAPVVRAGVMGVLVLLSQQFGRKTTMVNVLLVTASTMLFINPRLMRDDIGFELSMFSTIALIYFAPLLEQKLKFIPEDFSIRESITSTLSATFFALPIIFLSFGQLSILGPIANLFVLSFLPATMFFGSIAVVLSYVNPVLAYIASAPAWALLNLELIMIDALAQLPYATILIPSSTKLLLTIFSILLIAYTWRKLSRKTSKQ